MSAIVYSPTGASRPVRNLGWLLRHWKGVESFRVTLPQGHRFGHCDVVLSAALRDGSCYMTNFADRTVLAGFLDRPVFRGVEVSWMGEVVECGKPLNNLVAGKEA